MKSMISSPSNHGAITTKAEWSMLTGIMQDIMVCNGNSHRKLSPFSLGCHKLFSLLRTVSFNLSNSSVISSLLARLAAVFRGCTVLCNLARLGCQPICLSASSTLPNMLLLMLHIGLGGRVFYEARLSENCITVMWQSLDQHYVPVERTKGNY